MSSREDALQEIVAIARREGISAQEIAAALKPSADAGAQESSSVLRRVFSYMGGILILSGIGYFIATFWPLMNSLVRIGITLGTGITCYAMALNYLRDNRFERAVTPLFLLAALFQPAGLFVTMDEYSLHTTDPRYAGLLVAGVMLVQQAFTFRATGRTVLLFNSLVFAGCFLATLFDIIGMQDQWVGIVIGLSFLFITYSVSNTRHRPICGFWYFISSIIFLAGLFDVVEHTVFEPISLVVGLGLLYISTVARSRSLLLVSVLFTLWYIGYFSEEHFANSLGWPVTLILIGCAFLGLSSAAMKINRRIKSA